MKCTEPPSWRTLFALMTSYHETRNPKLPKPKPLASEQEKGRYTRERNAALKFRRRESGAPILEQFKGSLHMAAIQAHLPYFPNKLRKSRKQKVKLSDD